MMRDLGNSRLGARMAREVRDAFTKLCVDTRGESLAETLVGILIGTFSVIVLLSATLSATDVNQKAHARNTEIQIEQEYAASFGSSGAESGITQSMKDGAKITFTSTTDGSVGKQQSMKANYYGGRDFISYTQKLVKTGGGSSSSSYLSARTGEPTDGAIANDEERALSVPSSWPQPLNNCNLWLEETSNGKKYLAIRSSFAITSAFVPLVYYEGHYYHFVRVYNEGTSYESTDNVAADFAPNTLDTTKLDTQETFTGSYGSRCRWVMVG